MVSVMRVDVAPLKQLIIASAVAILILILSIIIGVAGPPVYDKTTFFAYDCPGNSHEWNWGNCNGVQLALNTSWWYQQVPPISSLNRFWALEFAPFTTIDTSSSPSVNLQLQVELSGTNDPNPKEWYLISNDTVAVYTICPSNPCLPAIVVYEEALEYKTYFIGIQVDNGENFLGDVQFTFWRDHVGFSKLEIAFRTIYLILTAFLFGFYLYKMKPVPSAEWSWEQRALVILFIGGILQANPLFSLQYAFRGWFFHFIESLFATSFITIYLLFSLLSIDKLRNEEIRVEFSSYHIPKLIVCGVYAVLSVVLYAWVNIRDRLDPVEGRPDTITGIQVFFYIVATIYVCVIIWLLILLIMTIPVAKSKPYVMSRLLFIGIPTGVVGLSILIGIFTGTFGPLNISAVSMMYYLTLNHVYIWVMAFGYWPVTERYSVGNPREEDAITKYDFVKSGTL
eukprot:TRINITY_DN7629_c0_g1_i1.p1 TRINITY_DN7629_c0_g1~~TRINITY_DN7629_c0_g1_i1.p1  ORF type:complete len:453 (-),score=56.29 TRINITY_DN7629_c0_g1_i1:103-1461(-)